MQPSRTARLPHALRRSLVGIAALAAATAIGLVACTDGPPAPSGPGNVVVDDSMQDAVATVTEDAYISPPQGVADAGDGSATGTYDMMPEAGGSTGYADVQSPMAACSSCKCDKRVGYCLENGTSLTSTAAPIQGFCGLSKTAAPAIGCNALPAACAAAPTCECILDSVQPPLGCYPECSSAAGFFDVFCAHP